MIYILVVISQRNIHFFLLRRKIMKIHMKNNRGITFVMLVIIIVILLMLLVISFIQVSSEDKVAAIKEDAEDKNAPASAHEINENTLNKEQKEELIIDGSYIEVNGIKSNSPKLLEGMEPVYWDKDHWETPQNQSQWYDYNPNTKQWANAITEDGSMWVWIPRYSYKISSNLQTNIAGTIDIVFVDTANKGADGKIYCADYPSSTSNTMAEFVVHPAFIDGSKNNFVNGEWDYELAGLWVAKFEMSAENNNDVNIEPGNVELSATIRMVSKPGVPSWRNITIKKAYNNSYKYDRAKESHLMKNSEWRCYRIFKPKYLWKRR
jgi:competence protein ComGC